MRIVRNGIETAVGPTEWFTGGVNVDSDRVVFEPGEDHWQGAAPTPFMTHPSTVEVDETGNSTTWAEDFTATLVRVPGSGHSDETMRSLVTLTDVMATGHHAAVWPVAPPGTWSPSSGTVAWGCAR